MRLCTAGKSTQMGAVQTPGRATRWNKPNIRVAHTQPGGQTKTPTPPHQQNSCGSSGVRATDQPVPAKTIAVLSTIKWEQRKRVKLAAVKTKSLSEEGKASLDGAKQGGNTPGSGGSPKGEAVVVEIAWDVPMSMVLPIQVTRDATLQPPSFLDTTPADPGIREWVWSGIQNNRADLSVMLVCVCVCVCVCVQIRGQGEGGVVRHQKDRS